MSLPVNFYIHDMKKVGEFTFGLHILPVYFSLEEPLFRSSDVMELMGDGLEYGGNIDYFNDWIVKKRCEADEYYLIPYDDKNDPSMMQVFICESGLYSLLAQSNSRVARFWRRVIFDELTRLRKERGLNIVQQFEEWDTAAGNYYFDDATGKLMKSITVAGGDVEQEEA